MTEQDQAHPAVVNAPALPAEPWRNGAGTTRQIAAASHPDAPGFLWRLSLADLEADAPFSAFPGVQRIHVPVAGEPYLLRVEGTEHTARRCRPLEFPGEAEVSLRLGVKGRRRALNLMVDAAAAEGHIQVLRPSAPGDGPWRTDEDTVAVVIPAGGEAVVAGRRLGPLQVMLTGGEPVPVQSVTRQALLVRVSCRHRFSLIPPAATACARRLVS